MSAKKSGEVSAEALREWLVRAVSESAGQDPAQIGVDRPLTEFGLGSVQLVALAARLSDRLGRPVDPTLAYDHPTIASMARALSSGASAVPPATAERSPGREPGQAVHPRRDSGSTADEDPDEVAIISMACRFPGGADDPQGLWRLLEGGEDAVSEAPEGRWDTEALLDPDPEAVGKAYTLRGGYLGDIDRFDASFFGISAREAAAMDPQQRLLLQTGWEAIERAGIVPEELNGSATGVYVGLYGSGYPDASRPELLDGHVATGASASVASGRLAYTLGLEGPAVTVDTACSSSLVALHLAANALRSGECDLALAGGATVMVSPRGHVEFSRLRGLSPSGRCRPFADDADGVVWAEGCGLVLLKRLRDARRDGDRVLAVVKGSAVNQDGRSQGLTAPNGRAQERVLRAALAAARLRPDALDYVEAHGTGTTLGDPIEGRALAEVFGPHRPADRPLAVGSLKSNIGHTQAAAGIGGIIKTVLSLQHELLPASLHAETPTRHVDWAGGGLDVCGSRRPWPRGARIRRAGVSAFGFSGTNAHVILEEAPDGPEVLEARDRPEVLEDAQDGPVILDGPEVLDGLEVLDGPEVLDGLEVLDGPEVLDGLEGLDEAPDGPEVLPAGQHVGDPSDQESGRAPVTLFPLSARGLPALRAQARRLLDALTDDPRRPLPAVARTLARHRTHFEHRAAVVAGHREELLAGLRGLASGQDPTGTVVAPRRVIPPGKLAFVLPGQGSQWAGMGRELLAGSPLFADEIDRCDAALRPHTGWSVQAVLRGDPGAPSLERVDVVQPVLFAVMVALAALWRAHGVTPDAVVGHSQGEVAAACVAGALGLNDAAAVVALRARALTAVTGTGGMAVAALPLGEVEARLAVLGGGLSVAAVNSDMSTVVAGDTEPLESFLAGLERDQVFARRIPVDYASHSAGVEPVRETLLAELDGIVTWPTSIAWYSTVSGDPVHEKSLEADYWYRNLRDRVRFADTVRRMLDDGVRYFVELSPHPSLLPSIESVAARAGIDVAAVGSLRRDEGGEDALPVRLGELYAAGHTPHWPALFPAGPPAELPTYPFAPERHWLPSAPPRPAGRGTAPLVDTHVEASDEPGRHVFQTDVDLRDGRFAYLRDHRVSGEVWLPAAAFLEMALEAVSGLGGSGEDVRLTGVRFEQPLPLDADTPVRLQLVLRTGGDGTGGRFTIASRTPGDGDRPTHWVRHVSGDLDSGPGTTASTTAPDVTPAALWERCTEQVDVAGVYAALTTAGIDYGPAFRGLTEGRRGPTEALAGLARVPRAGHRVHPAVLDSAFHAAALPGDAPDGTAFVPAGIGRLRFTGQGTAPVRVACALRDLDGGTVTLDLRLLDEEERPVVEIEGLELAAVSPLDAALFEVRWQPRPPAGEPPAPGTWLILADDSGVAADLARRLGPAPCVVARKGDAFAAERPGRYVIDPRDPRHLERLLDEAFPTEPPERVLQLFGLDAPAIDSAETAEEAARLCCVSTLHLVRALTDRPRGPAPRLFLVTRGSQPAGDSTEVTLPQQALGWGFGKAVALEHPELRTTLIDLPADGGTDALWSQLRHADGERLIALRGTGRLVPRLAPTRPDGPGDAGVRPDGTYLVTGGLGGLGRVAAERLVRQGARGLALLSRGVPSPDAERWIAGLRDRGVAVHLARADVADRDGLAAALDLLRREAPPIRGVVHAAGVLDDATLPNLTAERVLRVLAPKVLGTALLTELVPEAESLVLFSSAAGLLGSAGQSPYGAANAFMDAWAHHLSLSGRRALSLDWGPWAEVGMVTESDARISGTARSGLLGLAPEEGGALFERVLSTARRQLAPLALDRQALALDAEARSRPLLLDLVPAPPGAPGTADLVARALALPTAREQTDLLETYVRTTVREVAGGTLTDLTQDTSLKQLGFDSLMLVRLRTAFVRELGVELAASSVFAAADLRALASELRDALVERADFPEQGPPEPGPTPETGAGVPAYELRPATRDVVRLLRSARPGVPGAAHAVGLAVRLTVPITRRRLTDILARLAARHAALRTAIVTDAGRERRLRVEREPAGPLLRWSDLGEDAEVDVDQRLRALLEPPFDLAVAPLWRFELLDGGARGSTLLFGAHHGVSDLQSLLLVAAEIDTELSGTPLDGTVSNRDIDVLLQAQTARPARDTDGAVSAWREEFAGSGRLELTLTHPRPEQRSFRAGSVTLEIPDGLLDRVATRASRLAVTPAAFCLGVLTVLLARLRDRDRFVLAVPVDTRMHVGAFDAVGFFGVPVPFPARAEPGERIDEVVRRTDGHLERVLAKDALFSDTLAALAAQGLYRSDAPLVEVYFNHVRPSNAGPVALEFLPSGTGYSDIDLMVTVTTGIGLLRLDHNLDIMDGAAATGIGEEFLRLLAEAADDPATPARPSPVPVPAPETVRVATPVPEPPSGGSLALAATFALGDLPLMCGAALDAGDPAGSSGTEVEAAPYHHVLAGLQDPSGVFARPTTAVGAVLLRATDLERFGPVTDELLDGLRTEYPAALRALSERTRRPLIVGFLPSARRDDRLERWERDVAGELSELPGIALLGPDDWTRHHAVGEPFDDRTEELAHLPYTRQFQAAVALTLAEVVRTVRRVPPKVIAVDGDETLWGGVAGESGPDAVDLGGARALLARRLLRWRDAGTLLVLVSNNDEETVRAVLDRPDSVLRAEHFSVLSATWGRKSERLEEAARTLGLGTDTFLYLDDNPVEIAAMRAALPEVLSVTCPAVGDLESFVSRLWPMVPLPATAEDSLRPEFYRQERAREVVREQVGFEEFLDRLELEVDVRPLSEADVQRGDQLIRRTNQFTLRARSADGQDLERWRSAGEVWTASARDRFGDYGQVGLLAVRRDGDRLDVLGWALSCRALGRGVEERLLRWLADRSEALDCTAVRITAERTPRNAPARRLVAALGGGGPDDERLELVTTPERLRAFRSWRH
ncbi:HAD-IIIC family phosphatase [Streptomyces sp. NPDC090303]|uniref:HAD-IIIC family phosphatase n=1 Tax=Streptomyces sp. NPDC090303 TaxID=3365960 RepID=UPI003814083F